MISKREFASLFSVGDIITSGGNQTKVEIAEIKDDFVVIRPTDSKKRKPHRLTYGRLDATVDGFSEIDPKRIVPTFQAALVKRGQPKDHTNETYLYGVAREYIFRQIQAAPDDDALPEEIPAEVTGLLTEGAKRLIVINSYERDGQARRLCIMHFKALCQVCGIDFAKTYGSIGQGFIHVHHLKPLSEIGEEYLVDPIKDLVPVCPNCHAMLHRGDELLSLEQLRSMIEAQGLLAS